MKDAATDRLWRRAQEHLAHGQVVPARAVLEALLVRNPDFIHAHLTLGGIAWREHRPADAARHALAAARLAQHDAMDLLRACAGLVQVGEFAAARQCLNHARIERAAEPLTLAQAAPLMQQIGDHPGAMALYDRAAKAGLTAPDFRFARATEMAFNGRLAEAADELERCAGAGKANGRAHVELARLRRQTPEHNHLDTLERARTAYPAGSIDAAAIEFARYKELEDLGRHEQAWTALANGNAIMAALTRYDPAREERLHAGLRDVFLSPAPSIELAHDGPAPIFIVGMTRSGTTLLDRIIGNHPRVESAGELGDFGRQLRHVAGRCIPEMLDEPLLERLPGLDYAEVGRRYLAQTQWRAHGKPYYVDKLPANWLLLGAIRRALPRARIVHIARDPMDVCFSNLRAFYGDAQGWSYGQQQIAHHHAQYLRMMAHWHAVLPGCILDVAYTDLVRDPETVARGIFAFCGLDFPQGCLDLSRNRSAVATLSMAQVRGGIHAGAFGEWRPYQHALAPLREALGRAPI